MRHILQTLRLLWLLLAINTKAAVSLRRAFLLRSFFMFINNLIFFVTWIILFTKVDHIGGWSLRDCALMYGLVALSVGMFAVSFGGVSSLSRLIAEGELDSFLSQPKSVLISSIASKTNIAGWGDILSGLILIGFSGYTSLEALGAVLICSLCSMVLYTVTGVLIHSSAFWLGPTDSLSMQVHEFVLAFSLYPGTIFSGMFRIVLFTLIPAGFISFLPVEIIRSFSWKELGFLLLGVLSYTSLALFIFSAGLRRYESGNKLVLRG